MAYYPCEQNVCTKCKWTTMDSLHAPRKDPWGVPVNTVHVQVNVIICNSPATKLEAQGRESQWWVHAAEQDRVMRALSTSIATRQSACTLERPLGRGPHIQCNSKSKSTYTVLHCWAPWKSVVGECTWWGHACKYTTNIENIYLLYTIYMIKCGCWTSWGPIIIFSEENKLSK